MTIDEMEDVFVKHKREDLYRNWRLFMLTANEIQGMEREEVEETLNTFPDVKEWNQFKQLTLICRNRKREKIVREWMKKEGMME